MNTDNLKGNLDKLTGKIKETVGSATGNTELEAEGKLQQVKGSAQDSLGHAKDAGHNLGETLKKATE